MFGSEVAGDVVGQQLQIAADHLQDVVEIVRHSAREFSNSFHFLGLAELRLSFRPLCHGCGNSLFQVFIRALEDFLRLLAVADVDDRSWLCKNSRRYNRTRNFGPYGHAESKKTQKFVFRSALRPNQISFSHDQDPI